MDTILINRSKIEKTATTAVGLLITICILLSQNLLISAKDLGIGAYTGLSPNLDFIKIDAEQSVDDFNKKISNKYNQGGEITAW